MGGEAVAQSTPKPRDPRHLHQEGPPSIRVTPGDGCVLVRAAETPDPNLKSSGPKSQVIWTWSHQTNLIWEASDKMNALVCFF